MNVAEFPRLIDQIGWSEIQTAKRIKLSQSTLRRLIRDDELPESIILYLRIVAAVIRAIPLPEL